MKIVLLIVILLVSAVLMNSREAPETPPWEAVVLPVTAQACQEAKGTWVERSMPFSPYTIEQPQAAHCEMAYPDGGAACLKAGECSSKVCIVHPVTRLGRCQAILPPRGRFEYFNDRGYIRSIELPL